MGASSLAPRRPAATGLPTFPLPLPEIPSTRYPRYAPTAMNSPSDISLVARRTSPLTSTAPRAPALTPSSNAPAPLLSSATSTTSSSTTSITTVTTNAPSTRVLTPSGAAHDGFSTSAAHSSGSQSSQPGGPPLYYSNQMSGSWPTPGGTQLSAYTYANSSPTTSNSGSLSHQPYARGSLYGPASSTPLQHYGGRTSTSASNGESLPPPQSYQDQPHFAGTMAAGGGGAGGGGGALGSPLSQAHGGHQSSGLAQPALSTPSSNVNRPGTSGQNTPGGSGSMQDGNPYRQPPTPTNLYPPSSTSHQSSFPSFTSSLTQPPPTTTSPATTSGQIHRGLGSISAMAPPLHFSGGRGPGISPPMVSYASYSQVPGPVLTNVHHPGAPLSMVGGVGMGGYGHHHPGLPAHHLYLHQPSPPGPPQDRPFKCDECKHSFNRNHDLKRHKRIHMEIKPFPCGHCEKAFSRKDALKRHKLVKGCGRVSPPEGAENKTTDTRGSPRNHGDGMSDDREGSPRIKKE